MAGIKDFTPRLYQETIMATAAKSNTLVVLSTGLGKTNIFLMLAAHRLNLYPESKVLLMGPTKPLIEQYLDVFKKHFEISENELAVMTGQVAPEKRAKLWADARVIFSTPQGLENDVIGGKISLEDVSLLGFDEAHRAVGDYSYVLIARKYMQQARFPRVIGMTASPGSEEEKITEVCENLGIEDIEARTEDDSDVKQYVQEIEIDYIKVDLPQEFIEIKKALEECIRSKLEEVKRLGYVKTSYGMKKTELLKLQAELHGRIAKGEKDFPILRAVSLLAEAMKAGHALELVETQGISALHKYIQRLQEEGKTTKVKALKNLLSDGKFKAAIIKTGALYEEKVDHPKLAELKRIITEEMKSGTDRIIVFSQYRDSSVKIKEELDSIGVKSEIFVGQAKKETTGLSQKEQKEILDRFREGEFNALIATSIAEEGLDVPKVSLVVFYEPIPSAIRSIQRRGRTARQEKGKVIILMARNTRDEAYRWVAHHKEERMHRLLTGLKHKIKLAGNSSPKKFEKENDSKGKEVKIFADHREKGKTVNELSEKGIAVELKMLPVGDYLCSSRVAVEIKTAEDFVNSIIDGRLLQQLNSLKRSYERPVLIIEGGQDIYSVRSVHPNAIRGMLATIAVSYNIPVLHSRDYIETAGLLMAIAKREQENGKNEPQMHSSKPLTLKEQQEYVISALPGVEKTIAKSLLKSFGSVKKIINAEKEELKKAELVGDKKADEIRRVVDGEYTD